MNRRFSRIAPLLVAPFLVVGAACHSPPERACNRVRFGWPFFQLDATSDLAAREGIQIDFDVRSDLEAGTRGTLFLRMEDSEEQTYLGEADSDSEGLLSFSDITIPEGELLFILEARDECGTHRTGRRTYVWDGLGMPKCSMELGVEPEKPADGSIPVLASEHDEDSVTDGMQVRVLVDAGRPDMEISLFARDREGDETQEFSSPSDASGSAAFDVTLPPGEQALRAVCHWEPRDLRPSSATHLYFVDTP